MQNIFESNLQNLIKISKKIGYIPDFVQGAGGNTSVKLDASIMAIKASGYLLKDITEQEGLAFVNHRNIKNHIIADKISAATEEEFSAFISSNILDTAQFPYLKPSIETGFHALLPYKYIIHTHSVYINIICCSKGGKYIVRDIFPEAIWVRYANPGKEITSTIARAIAEEPAKIIFMQNHGVIVSGDNANETYALHSEVNKKVIKHFNINPYFKTEEGPIDFAKLNEKVIFPDQVVYLNSEDLSKSRGGIETFSAYNYIMKNIKSLKIEPNIIAKKDIDYIENMESEKYRKAKIRNGNNRCK